MKHIEPKPFPWKCRSCGQREVYPKIVENFSIDVRVDKELRNFVIPKLEIPTCNCGEKVFTSEVDEQMQKAIREINS